MSTVKCSFQVTQRGAEIRGKTMGSGLNIVHPDVSGSQEARPPGGNRQSR